MPPTLHWLCVKQMDCKDMSVCLALLYSIYVYRGHQELNPDTLDVSIPGMTPSTNAFRAVLTCVDWSLHHFKI